MMKEKMQGIFTGIVIGSLLTGGAAVAKTGSEMIEAWYQDIKIVINGSEITPKDAAGRVVEPFTNQGTTYLPVRAIGEALGKEVSWDGATHTVYINDTKKPTETPEPIETPAPTTTPTPQPTEEPSQHSFTTTEILRISGYREEDIKGEITLTWDSNRPNASFLAKMRCNNGGLADYVDCEITLVNTQSTTDSEITGNFRVILNDTVKYESIPGTITVEKGQLTLHTREYDYHLVAALENGEESIEKVMTYMSFQTVKMNQEACHGLIGMEYGETPEDTTFSGSFTQGDKKYNVELTAVSELTSQKLVGSFTVLCDGEAVATNAPGTLEDLSAKLGDALTLSVEGFSPVSIRLVEIGY